MNLNSMRTMSKITNAQARDKDHRRNVRRRERRQAAVGLPFLYQRMERQILIVKRMKKQSRKQLQKMAGLWPKEALGPGNDTTPKGKIMGGLAATVAAIKKMGRH